MEGDAPVLAHVSAAQHVGGALVQKKGGVAGGQRAGSVQVPSAPPEAITRYCRAPDASMSTPSVEPLRSRDVARKLRWAAVASKVAEATGFWGMDMAVLHGSVASSATSSRFRVMPEMAVVLASGRHGPASHLRTEPAIRALWLPEEPIVLPGGSRAVQPLERLAQLEVPLAVAIERTVRPSAGSYMDSLLPCTWKRQQSLCSTPSTTRDKHAFMATTFLALSRTDAEGTPGARFRMCMQELPRAALYGLACRLSPTGPGGIAIDFAARASSFAAQASSCTRERAAAPRKLMI